MASTTITTTPAGYGPQANDGLLRSLASADPAGNPMFRRVRSGRELRDFCIRTITQWG